MRLNERDIANALSIAATMSSGIGSNHGTMAKPLNMGLASKSGVAAARMAQFGLNGKPSALEAGRGFFEAFGGGFNRSRIDGRLGAPFAILDPGTSIKPYPCGVVDHPGIDAMLELVIANDLAPEEVASVKVRTGENTIAPGPLRIEFATNALEAKFCVPFQMAAAILRRKAGLSEFTDEFVGSKDVQDMQSRVQSTVAPEIAALGKDRIFFEITIHTCNGRVLKSHSPEHYRGGPRNPMSWDELCCKFGDAAAKVLDLPNQERFLANAAKLDKLAEARVLIASVVNADWEFTV